MNHAISVLLTICFEAVIDGMAIVRESQLTGPLASPSEEKKLDRTRVTAVDRASAKAMLVAVPDYLSTIIEDGTDRNQNSRYVFIADPIDGTRAFLAGQSISTVVAAFYDRQIRQIICCVSGEPISGRMWQAHTNGHTGYGVLGSPDDYLSYRRDCRVWPGQLGHDSIVFLDVSHGFPYKTSDGETDGMVLTDAGMAHLIGALCRISSLQIAGTNIGNQSLVANGGEGAVGSITTAKGGPQDLCAALLVKNAGGEIRGLEINHHRAVSKDPLDPLSYNVLITANSPETADRLEQLVLAAASL